jgi:hypothetical protein
VGEKSLEELREVLSLHDHVSCTVEVVDPLAKFLANGVEHKGKAEAPIRVNLGNES